MLVETMIAIKKESKVTYQEVADKSGVPLSTVQKVLGGITAPRGKTLEALGKAMETFVSPGSPRRMGAVSFPELLVMYGHEEELGKIKNLKGKYASGELSDGNHGFGTGKSASSLQDKIRLAGFCEIYEKEPGEYTVEDYEKLPDNVRVELINGRFYDMAAPSKKHQVILREMMLQLANAIKKKKGGCKVYMAPSDVQLFDDDKTMVQPDLFILCKKEMISDIKRTHGAPEFVVEVLSKSTQMKDMTLKLQMYREAGVKEYWIVHPFSGYVIKCIFGENERTVIHTFDDTIPLAIYEGKISVDFAEIKQELIEEFGDDYLEREE